MSSVLCCVPAKDYDAYLCMNMYTLRVVIVLTMRHKLPGRM